ncbi:MAG: ABC transporter substrate-binding protein [Clostridia bacterium]|nr:ABC transporter substrate-binding protein [Clostridia bacterium]MBR0421011.1 ABC transporter substrate-binding protein [Clostridia bacterium]
MKKALSITLSLLMILSLVVFTGHVAEAANDTIKIGFFAPVTAPSAAADGESALNSAKLAVKLVNENGGINGTPVELVDLDDGLDTTEAANIAEKFAGDNSIAAVVSGSYSGPTKVAAPIFQEAGKLMVSAYAVHPDVTGAGDLIFSQSFPGAVQATGAAVVAAEQLKATKVAIIYVDLDFGTTQVNAFKAKLEKDYPNVQVVYEQGVSIKDSDMTSLVTAAGASGADLIYSVNYYEQAAEVLRQVGMQGLNIPVLGTEGADSWMLLEIAQEYANGLYITTNMNRDDQNEQTQAYIKNYREEFNKEPDMVGASVYDAFQVLFEAMKNVGTDTQAMKEFIANMKNFDTVTGTLLYYNAEGSAVKPIQVQLVTNGEYHYFGVVDDAQIIDPANY